MDGGQWEAEGKYQPLATGIYILSYMYSLVAYKKHEKIPEAK